MNQVLPKSRIRTGTTLTEVLVAIFIMGIGLLGVLALFPLGAVSMAQAIRADRAAHAGANGAGVERLWNVRNDPSYTNYLFNPDAAPTPPPDPTRIYPPSPAASYSVYVDPVGFGASLGVSYYIGSPNVAIRRASLSWASNPPTGPAMRARWFFGLDDFNFETQGIPENTGVLSLTNTCVRERRYSWAYFLRQEQRNTSIADNPPNLSVVVYERRVPLFDVNGKPVGENSYPADFSGTQATLYWGPGPTSQWPGIALELPPVKKGTWLLDATVGHLDGHFDASMPHGFFYRVIDVVPDATDPYALHCELGSSVAIENTVSHGGGPYAGGVAVVMETVVEVFDRGKTN